MCGAAVVEKIEELREEVHSARGCWLLPEVGPLGGKAEHGRLAQDELARAVGARTSAEPSPLSPAPSASSARSVVRLRPAEDEDQVDENEEVGDVEEAEEDLVEDDENAAHPARELWRFGSSLEDAVVVGLGGEVVALERKGGLEVETGPEVEAVGREAEATEIAGVADFEDIGDRSCHRSC